MSEQERRNTSITVELPNAQNSQTDEVLPVIIFMAVVGTIGILGNIITLKFYISKRRKSPTILFIISLAIVDLIVCIMFVPAIIELELWVNVMYPSNTLCKTMHFLCHWCLETSGLLVGCIAFDRYRKICRPSQNQITKKIALKAVANVVIFSSLMSARDFVTIDIVSLELSENTTSPLKQYCTTSDDPKLKLSVLIFNIADAVVLLILLGTIVFTYGNILLKMCKLKAVQRDDRRDSDNPNETQDVSESRNINATSNVNSNDVTNSNMLEHSSTARGTNDVANNRTTKRLKKTLPGQKKIRRSEWNITVLMLAVTLVCIVCFFPYFIVQIHLFYVKRAGDIELGLLTKFGLRLMYINSVLNPLIYCLFNPSFRRHVRSLCSCKQEH